MREGYGSLVCVSVSTLATSSFIFRSNMQEGDFRIVMINAYEAHTYHILCEVHINAAKEFLNQMN